MNRVIKFRAWCSGKHGSLTFSEDSMDYNVVLSKNGYWCDVEGGWDIHGEYETVPIMQFTGMKDCNGKEIYEGDIIEEVSNNVFNNLGVSYYEVMWGIDHWHINGTKLTLQELFNYCNNKIKVVGNIYETPKLYRRRSYTELIFGADLKQHTPEYVIEALKYMIGDTEEKPKDFPLPEGRCEWLFRSSSYYFGVNAPVSKLWYDDIGKNWVLSTRSNIKNYNGEIEAFLEWIKPYIDGGSGYRDMYAIVTYEEAESPDIYYLR